MLPYTCLSNISGGLAIGGLSANALADEYGTPLYIVDADAVLGTMKTCKSALAQYYAGASRVAFASKALAVKAIYRLAAEAGLCADVVSAGEMHTALSAGFAASDMILHGNSKTDLELNMALTHNIGRIVVDNAEELSRLSAMCARAGVTAGVQLRVKPGIDAHTHAYVQTGGVDSKFGFDARTGELMAAVKRVLDDKNISLLGLHCHIGSQILEHQPYDQTARICAGLLSDIRDNYGHTCAELNLGGGWGVRYTDNDSAPPIGECMQKLAASVTDYINSTGLPLPLLIVEPGRSIVAEQGITVYTVMAVKDIPGLRRFVLVDGGMGDNPRFIMYGSQYRAVCVENPEPGTADCLPATIGGRNCESGDIVVEHCPLPAGIKAGDRVAVLATGAFNYSMASNYNRVPRPAMVFVRNGQAAMAVRRESLDDLVRNDI